MNMQSQIAQTNDQLRVSLTPNICAAFVFNGVLANSEAIVMNLQTQERSNKIHITQGAMSCGRLLATLEAVRSFNSFTDDNDPYGEHDFGSFTIEGQKFFWKIDYFDSNFEFFQENGNRVLTIMLAEEY